MAGVLPNRHTAFAAGRCSDRASQLRGQLDKLLPALGYVLVVRHDQPISALARYRLAALPPADRGLLHRGSATAYQLATESGCAACAADRGTGAHCVRA